MEHDHGYVYVQASEELKRLRRKLKIPAYWSIQLDIVCPERMPQAYGLCDWRYEPNKSFQIAVRCDLSPAALEWIIAHELLEASLSEYGSFTHDLIDKVDNRRLREYLGREHNDTRDRYIEWLLRVLLRKDRPDVWED